MRFVLCFVVGLALACGDDDDGPDTGTDAGTDAPVDVGTDVPEDVAIPDAAEEDSAIDAGMCVPPGECDPFGADGCGEGEVCVLRDTGRTECREARDTADVGEPCGRAEDCLPGLMCVNVGGEATCHQTCPGGSVGRCPAEERCSGSIGDDCVLFCRERPLPCDIYAQDCEDPGDACTFASDPETEERYTGCREAGPNGLGQPCGSEEGFCQEGFVCIRREGVSTCHEVCDADDPDVMCTDDAEECVGLSTGWMVTYCRTPPPPET